MSFFDIFKKKVESDDNRPKLFFASDIHGSAKYCKLILEAFAREGAEKLVLLGDILYHGPRNPLPEEYAPAEVAKLLGSVNEKILCVRGNCDSEVDQMVLPFPILSDYAAIFADGANIYLSHGHREVPPLTSADVYITGHTHLPLNSRKEGFLHLNPGSVSLPKDEKGTRGYILFDSGTFYFKTLDGKIYDSVKPI